jgi:biotin carboxyl carrier protein
MLKIAVNGAESREVEISQDGKIAVMNGKEVPVDFMVVDQRHFHLIAGHRSFDVELDSINRAEKTMVIMLNGQRQVINIKDRFDDLLQQLGMDSSSVRKDTSVKAPMPGLVLEVVVQAGQSVEKDSPLLILEAMKMENVIKSPGRGVVSKIHVQKGATVEKNAILIEFEA